MPGLIRSGTRTLTQATLADHVARAARGFTDLGVRPGDAVALMLRNDLAFFEARFAVGSLGAYSVPVNWHYTGEELAYILTDSDARALVIHADLLARVAGDLPADLPVLVVATPPEIAVAYAVDPDLCAVPAGRTDWDAWVTGFAPWDGAPVEPPAAVIYTSGTTGRPKGVRRHPADPETSRRTLAMFEKVLGITGQARTTITGPLYHSAPHAYGDLMARAGAEISLMPRFDPEGLLARIQNERLTHLYMVPTMFVRLLKLPEGVRKLYDVSSLRDVVHAAAPCPPHIKRGMIDWWGPVINEFYGSTETSAVVYCTAPEWLAHPGTVGRVLPEAIVTIQDDDGNTLPTGAIGEVFCRQKAVTDFTYHKDDEKRRSVERDGLVTSGDVGYLDEDGFLYLCDRKKDMVISGGVNIYPAEIEAALHAMPGVHDCAVFGIPDDEYGEALAAVIQPQPGANLTEQAVRAFVRSRLAGYKVPRVIEFHASLPREDSGKIFKRRLREPWWANAGRAI